MPEKDKYVLCPDPVPDGPPLLYRESGAVASLLFNRPQKCNALSLSLLEELRRRLAELRTRRDLRVLVIAGAGNHFCSGLDLLEAVSGETVELEYSAVSEFLSVRLPESLLDSFSAGEREGTLAVPKAFWMPRLVAEVLSRLASLPQAVIGAARGCAYGGGGGILAASDIVLAEPNVRFGFPECRLGIAPALLHPFLVRRAGTSLYPFLLTGEPVLSADALRLGLIDMPVPEGKAAESAERAAAGILAGAPERVGETKKLFRGSASPPPGEIIAGLLRHWESWNEPSAAEGIAAFAEKRPPRW